MYIQRVMASSNPCSVCKKRAGICICQGCKALFCDGDFQSHRSMLLNELDGITVNRNELQAKLNQTNQNQESGNRILAQIDQWQKTTIEKVNQAAELARKQVFKILNSKKEEIMRHFQSLSQDLKDLRDNQGVLEQDLTRLKSNLRQLNEDLAQLAQSQAIQLNTEQSNLITWQSMISVEEKSSTPTREYPNIIGDKILNSELSHYTEKWKMFRVLLG